MQVRSVPDGDAVGDVVGDAVGYAIALNVGLNRSEPIIICLLHLEIPDEGLVVHLKNCGRVKVFRRSFKNRRQ